MERDLGRAATRFTDKIRDALGARGADQVAEAMAREASGIVKRRTREGFGVATDGASKSRLKPLSPAYIERRRVSRLSSFTTPGKSNLTFSSELLESIGIKRIALGHWVFHFRGTHEGGLTNERLARYVSRARPFCNLAPEETERVLKVGRRTFDDLVKRSIR